VSSGDQNGQNQIVVTQELLTQTVAAAVEPIKADIRWHKWLLLALVGAVLMPNLGGPDPSVVTSFLLDPPKPPPIVATR
jgi:hypothetical protein